MSIVNETGIRYPVIHRRKVPFQPKLETSARIRENVDAIQRLDAELERFCLSLDDFEELITEAVASNVHFSTSLEGNPLSLPEVRRVTRRTLRENKVPEKRPTIPMQEIYNHLSVWLDPESWRPPWTLAQVRNIHALLMFEIDPGSGPGQFRTTETSIVSDSGQETFIPCPAKHIEDELASLLDWSGKQSGLLHPVALAAIFFHEFESIHPFKDGNGRVGRTLFHGLLQSTGLPNSNLCLIEQELIRDREGYYRILGWTDQESDYTRLLEFFTDAIRRAYQNAVERLAQRDLPSSRLSEDGRRVLMFARRHEGWFDVRTAQSWVSGVGDQTVRAQLAKLVKEGILAAQGRTRSRRFRYVHPYEELKARAKPLFRQAPWLKEAFAQMEQRNPRLAGPKRGKPGTRKRRRSSRRGRK